MIDRTIMFYLIAYLFQSVVVCLISFKRNRKPLGFWLLSLILPILPIILLYMLPAIGKEKSIYEVLEGVCMFCFYLGLLLLLVALMSGFHWLIGGTITRSFKFRSLTSTDRDLISIAPILAFSGLILAAPGIYLMKWSNRKK